MIRLAIYDMDKTITTRPTWTAFLVHTAARTAPWRLALLPAAGLATIGYALRLVDRARLKEMTHRLLLGAPRVATIADAADTFAGRTLHDGILPGAARQIAADRAGGWRLVMATASYRTYAGAIATRLGFEVVIGTEVVEVAGRLLPRIAGENCYGAAKLRAIERWLAGQGLTRSEVEVRFYSDHVSDAPALDWADEGVAVNPHPPLRLLARERGWRVADWS